MMNSVIQEQRGWVLLLVDSERHYLIGNAPVCGLNFVPAIAETDYETHNVSGVCRTVGCAKRRSNNTVQRFGDEARYAVRMFGTGQDITRAQPDPYNAEKRRIDPLLLTRQSEALC
jgi:hypothetical protein